MTAPSSLDRMVEESAERLTERPVSLWESVAAFAGVGMFGLVLGLVVYVVGAR